MFKQCPLCQHVWKDRAAFLADPGLVIIGYQVCFDRAREGLFLFNHQCETTMALKVSDFDDLYSGVRYDNSATGTEECSGFCLSVEELRACSAKCRYAFARDIIQIILDWPKG